LGRKGTEHSGHAGGEWHFPGLSSSVLGMFPKQHDLPANCRQEPSRGSKKSGGSPWTVGSHGSTTEPSKAKCLALDHRPSRPREGTSHAGQDSHADSRWLTAHEVSPRVVRQQRQTPVTRKGPFMEIARIVIMADSFAMGLARFHAADPTGKDTAGQASCHPPPLGQLLAVRTVTGFWQLHGAERYAYPGVRTSSICSQKSWVSWQILGGRLTWLRPATKLG